VIPFLLIGHIRHPKRCLYRKTEKEKLTFYDYPTLTILFIYDGTLTIFID